MIKDCERKIYVLINISIPTDNNISVKEYNKISQYKDLEIEIEKMWYFKTTTVSVMVEAQGMSKKETDKHMNKISGCHDLYEIAPKYSSP